MSRVGRWVGIVSHNDSEPEGAKRKRLTIQLTEGAKLDAEIRENLRELGYGTR